MKRYTKRQRLALRNHMDAQYRRNQGNPKERTERPSWYKRGSPREYRDPAEPVRLADVWPNDS